MYMSALRLPATSHAYGAGLGLTVAAAVLHACCAACIRLVRRWELAAARRLRDVSETVHEPASIRAAPPGPHGGRAAGRVVWDVVRDPCCGGGLRGGGARVWWWA
jgi:hypothetical protein